MAQQQQQVRALNIQQALAVQQQTIAQQSQIIQRQQQAIIKQQQLQGDATSANNQQFVAGTMYNSHAQLVATMRDSNATAPSAHAVSDGVKHLRISQPGTSTRHVASINVVGGYMVTDRMLAMFKKKEG